MRETNTTCNPALSQTKTLLIISVQLYNKITGSPRDNGLFSQCGSCPVCESGPFRYHATYRKYFYERSITIIRVRCRKCRSTHALIPEFSLPSTSIGTEEAESYLQARRHGQSQQQASKIFTSRGMGDGYGMWFEKRIEKAIRVAKAVFPQQNNRIWDLLPHSPGRVAAVEIKRANAACLEHGLNPLFFSRRTILRIREIKTGSVVSHNRGAIWTAGEHLDSS